MLDGTARLGGLAGKPKRGPISPWWNSITTGHCFDSTREQLQKVDNPSAPQPFRSWMNVCLNWLLGRLGWQLALSEASQTVPVAAASSRLHCVSQPERVVPGCGRLELPAVIACIMLVHCWRACKIACTKYYTDSRNGPYKSSLFQDPLEICQDTVLSTLAPWNLLRNGLPFGKQRGRSLQCQSSEATPELHIRLLAASHMWRFESSCWWTLFCVLCTIYLQNSE